MIKKKFNTKFNINNDRLHKILLNFLGNLFFCYCLIICLALILFSAVTIECKVNGTSMQPTLNGVDEKKNDYVYVNIHDNDYNYGDIVVINVSWDDEPIIKRIVGLPGDKIDVVFHNNEWKLSRNDEIIDEEYLFIDTNSETPTSEKNGMFRDGKDLLFNLKESSPQLFEDGKYIVGENEIFALGDHRAVSVDSSEYGSFKYSEIMGKVELIRYYDINEFYFYFDYIVRGRFVNTFINMF